jgi:hypothetical protein
MTSVGTANQPWYPHMTFPVSVVVFTLLAEIRPASRADTKPDCAWASKPVMDPSSIQLVTRNFMRDM